MKKRERERERKKLYGGIKTVTRRAEIKSAK
jgi:hypothetical protein